VQLGDTTWQTTAPVVRCRVSQCAIHDLPNEYYGSCGITLFRGQQCMIDGCEIFNLPYVGIYVEFSLGVYYTVPDGQTQGTQLLRNHISNLMWGMGDGAGIYGNGPNDGMCCAGNAIHDIPRGVSSNSRHALYWDSGTRGRTDVDTLIFRAGDNVLHEHDTQGRNRLYRTVSDSTTILYNQVGQNVGLAGNDLIDLPVLTASPETLLAQWGAGLDAQHRYLLDL